MTATNGLDYGVVARAPQGIGHSTRRPPTKCPAGFGRTVNRLYVSFGWNE
jgi:hypothetical protein